MQLLTWILIGTVIGWGTGKALKGNGYGPLMDIFMGVSGAVLGWFLISFAGLSGLTGLTLTMLGVMISASLVTLLAAYVNGRRMDARQLEKFPHSTMQGLRLIWVLIFAKRGLPRFQILRDSKEI